MHEGETLMYNHQLDTFLVVTDTKSFSKAAKALYITPSAVIQQINALENHLQVSLFDRSNKGIVLTKQGAYLRSAVVDFISMGKGIQEKLSSIPNSETSLILGTSLHEKCRVFYDFWVLFSEGKQSYKVEMMTVDTHFPLPGEVDFVEAVNENLPWQEMLDYLELCRCPYGVAAARDHPLARKKTLRFEDLKDYTLVLQKESGDRDDALRIRKDLREHGISFIERSGYGSSVVWEASIEKQLLVLPVCYRDVLFDMEIRTMPWDFSVSYGFFSRPNRSGLARSFLEFVKQKRDSHPEIIRRLMV